MIAALKQGYQSPNLLVTRQSGMGPAQISLTMVNASFTSAGTSGSIGTSQSSGSCLFHATSDADALFSFTGAYTQTEAGVTVTLQSAPNVTDGIARSAQLALSNPDENDVLTGTLTYTRDGAVYTGGLTLTPVATD